MNAAADAPPRTAQRRRLDFLVAFACIFGGLSLPLPFLPQVYVQGHALLASCLLPGELASNVKLGFLTSAQLLREQPWSLTLQVLPPPPQLALTVPIDLRGLLYLPSACFVALALATPFASRRSNLKLLGCGIAILEPLLLGLVALPVLSFLGGTGPVRAFELGRTFNTLLQIAYRALVASPSMAYVIPLLLWLALLHLLRFPKSEDEHSVFVAGIGALLTRNVANSGPERFLP